MAAEFIKEGEASEGEGKEGREGAGRQAWVPFQVRSQLWPEPLGSSGV